MASQADIRVSPFYPGLEQKLGQGEIIINWFPTLGTGLKDDPMDAPGWSTLDMSNWWWLVAHQLIHDWVQTAFLLYEFPNN